MSGSIKGSRITSSNFGRNFLVPAGIETNIYLSPMLINVRVYSMRPNTRVYSFFDNIPISNLCTPCNNSVTDSFNPVGSEGATLTTSSTGVISFIIRVPKNTFYSRTSYIRVMDVSSLTDAANTTTQAVATFFGDGRVVRESATSGTLTLSTASELNVAQNINTSTIPETTPSSLSAGIDPYYYNLSKVINVKPNSASIYIGGFEINEQ